MIDRYTKGCLTVIAVSLAVIVLKGHPPVAPPVKPAPEIQKVVICQQDWNGRLTGKDCGRYAGGATLDVRVVNQVEVYGSLTVSNDGSFAQ